MKPYWNATSVLADGGRSGLREQLGIGVKTRPYNQSALIANITPSRGHNGEAFRRFTDEGPMALLPHRTTVARWCGPASAWTPSAWPAWMNAVS